MKAKTAELQGAALEWAVATALGEKPYLRLHPGIKPQLIWLNDFSTARYSTDWAMGGPIIDRMFVEGAQMGSWMPNTGHEDKNSACWAVLGYRKLYYHGPTSLVAAMRCFVASKLGDEVDVPDEL